MARVVNVTRRFMFCGWPSARGTGDVRAAPALVFAFPFLRLKAISIFFFFFFALICGRLTITMNSYPRIRKTIKWGGAAVTVLLVVVWIGSGWAGMYCGVRAGYAVRVGFGGVSVMGTGPADPLASGEPRDMASNKSGGWTTGLYFPRWPVHYMEYQPSGWRRGTFWELRTPLYIPAVVVAGLAAIAWRLETRARRRAPLNLCPKCNYDRAGIAGDAKCPECGVTAKSV